MVSDSTRAYTTDSDLVQAAERWLGVDKPRVWQHGEQSLRDIRLPIAEIEHRVARLYCAQTGRRCPKEDKGCGRLATILNHPHASAEMIHLAAESCHDVGSEIRAFTDHPNTRSDTLGLLARSIFNRLRPSDKHGLPAMIAFTEIGDLLLPIMSSPAVTDETAETIITAAAEWSLAGAALLADEASKRSPSWQAWLQQELTKSASDGLPDTHPAGTQIAALCSRPDTPAETILAVAERFRMIGARPRNPDHAQIALAIIGNPNAPPQAAQDAAQGIHCLYGPEAGPLRADMLRIRVQRAQRRRACEQCQLHCRTADLDDAARAAGHEDQRHPLGREGA